jgi:lysine-specific demethylase 8
MPTIDQVPRETSAADLERLDRPAVIARGCADWPARGWTSASLAQRFGEVRVRAKVSTTHQHPDFHQSTLRAMFATEALTFAELLARFEGPDPARWLFTGDELPLLQRRDGHTRIDPDLAPLLDDAPILSLAPADRLYTVWAWFSGRGARTWLHYDNNGCHNLNAQLTGAKEVTLFSPDELPRMRPFPVGGDNPAVNCCSVDVERPGELGGATAWTARLEAGDLLFIPAWWFHTVRHLGSFNSNLNVWWKPLHPAMNLVSQRQALIDAARTGPGSSPGAARDGS